jgi:hypothetical protein
VQPLDLHPCPPPCKRQYSFSWDVVEPLAYFTSLIYTIVGIIYYIYYSSAPEYGSFKEYWTQRTYNSDLEKQHFDEVRYQRLKDSVQRYRAQLHAVRLARRVRI